MPEEAIWKAIDKLREYDLELTKCLSHMKGRLDIIGWITGATLLMIIGLIVSALMGLA